MDDLDIASEREQIARDRAIESLRNAKSDIYSTGFCLGCGEQIAAQLRWCDIDCRDDWQRFNKSK